MTSLMVIFVLLLVSRLNNQAGWRAAAAADLERRFQATVQGTTGNKPSVSRAKDDPNTVVIEVPNTLVSFNPQEYTLKPEGQQFLASTIPAWAQILCSEQVRPNIDNIVVEGHSDQTRWQNSTFEENKQKNLTLSQQRSMAIVSGSLAVLGTLPGLRDCFLQKLSATGRGEEEPADPANPASVRNRRVVFKIRLRPELVTTVADSLQKATPR
jgi:flagellar motor protein MotB